MADPILLQRVRGPARSTTDLKADMAFVASDIGLGNVDNTSDANKPVSTAQQTALDLKANLASPTLTGTPAAPTAALETNTTQLATTAFVRAHVGVPNVSVYSNTSQTGITAATWTKINFDTTVIDSGTYFDATNKRFTPGRAGLYQVIVTADLLSDPTVNCLYGVAIAKNGTKQKIMVMQGFAPLSGNDEYVPQVSALVRFNGSTDYVEGQAYIQSGATVRTIAAGASATTMEAYWIAP